MSTSNSIFKWELIEISTAARTKLHQDLGKWYEDVDVYLITSNSGGYANFHFDGFMQGTITAEELLKFYE